MTCCGTGTRTNFCFRKSVWSVCLPSSTSTSLTTKSPRPLVIAGRSWRRQEFTACAVADLDYSPLLELTSVYVFIWRRETNDQWRSHVVHWMRHGVQTEQEHFRCVVRLLLLRLENCELHADIVEAIVAQLRVVNTC
jgi:hypothetical protein